MNRQKPMTKPILAVTVLVSLMIATPAAAQDAGTATKQTLSGAYTGKVYSPYAHRSFPERPLWGDSHLHTSLSMDAGLFGNRLPPREAYRFARGEEVVSSSGQAARLSRPLDWLVIADHSDGMGMVGDVASGTPELLAYEQGARWNKGLEEGGDAAVQAALESVAADDGRPESAQRRDEIANFVRVTLEHLPSKYARALEMKYVQGCSVKEIATSLNIGEKAAESILSRSRAAFKERFRAIWDIDPNFIVD